MFLRKKKNSNIKKNKGTLFGHKHFSHMIISKSCTKMKPKNIGDKTHRSNVIKAYSSISLHMKHVQRKFSKQHICRKPHKLFFFKKKHTHHKVNSCLLFDYIVLFLMLMIHAPNTHTLTNNNRTQNYMYFCYFIV
jgi:hypothetical protein